MAELTLTYRGDKTEIIVLGRNAASEPWRDLLTLSPGEAMELGHRLIQQASALHDEQIAVRLPEQRIEPKTGREI